MQDTSIGSLVESAAKNYELGEVFSIKKLPGGYTNKSLLLDTEEGFWVLKIYKNHFNKNTVESQSKVVNDLYDKGLPVIFFKKGRDGKFTQTLKGDLIVTLAKYEESVTHREYRMKKTMMPAIAETLAKLHRALAKTEPQEKIGKLDLQKHFSELNSDSIEKAKDYFDNSNHKQYRDYLQKYIDTSDRLSKLTSEIKTDSSQLIHADYYIENLNVHNDIVETIYDFDEMIYAPVEYELGRTLAYLNEDLLLPEELISTFIGAYLKDNPASIDLDLLQTSLQFHHFYRLAKWYKKYRFLDDSGKTFKFHQDRIDLYASLDLGKIIGA